MANPILLPLMDWARKLRYPTLFKITAVAFAISVLWPFDPVPFLDEIVLGLGTLLLANWKDRNKTGHGRSGDVIDVPPGRDGGR
ncbi:DUF6116 family protein [Marilutibacter chinensis]|uniref:Transmembrane protein n=1 Tax=Marilutibacter chinensis TaxID=2912247 RepID=A0ABS9HNN7_9GAMM|nr:DUF6116 family protein [Lysobacter chinensis]MCF7220604.1 hypothetical protein [Lysobacter chinensis]